MWHQHRAANVINSGLLTMGASTGTNVGPLCIGIAGRPNGTETFLGAIDEVRISKQPAPLTRCSSSRRW